MASKLLAARAVATLGPGRHADGDGLYLQVSEAGSRTWLHRFQMKGKRHDMGLGRWPEVSLADARERHAEARRLIASGINPLEKKTEEKAVPTFGAFADLFIADMRPTWKSPVHARQWAMTMEVYAAPIRHLKVDAIETADVLKCLRPIWTEKPETAGRVRNRIEMILNAAAATGVRAGENPARYRGHLDRLLPPRKQLSRGHHAAMPYEDVPGFVARLRASPSMSAWCLEFTILTAARSGETYGARWCEIDMERALWTIPPARMKAGRQHQVPLSSRAMEILQAASDLSGSDPDSYVFPGAKRGRPLSVMAMTMVVRRLGLDACTVHGFRSAFRDWAGDATSYPRDVCEAALAHTIENRAEAAYRRGTALEKRRHMMQSWADYLGGAATLKKSPDEPLRLETEINR